ncbi:MAG: hypothetical protein Q8Q09_11320 [Deltaproteobacteria bacterium]|nr:hypothetical protein [Deltaproteobacteria bacterium]
MSKPTSDSLLTLTFGSVLWSVSLAACALPHAGTRPDSNVAIDATLDAMDATADALDSDTQPDATCPLGTIACNGACVNPSTDLQNCGSCGTACPAAGPSQSVACLAGACRSMCTVGFDDCTMAPGCETNLGTSIEHCGRCNSGCSLANATPRCAGGICDISACNAGFINCDGDISNGCETSVSTISNCGACGTVCSFANATPTCTAGACGFSVCRSGFADCDRNLANGCETPINTTSNCGACGVACNGATPLCDSAMGRCVSGCTAPAVRCGGTCVDVTNDPVNCGMCGTTCSYPNASGTCSARVCGIGACNPGFASCDGSSGNGCEANLNTNLSHCGMCGRSCSFANAAASCAGGICVQGACNAGFADCDGSAVNGCETNTNTAVTSCGRCGNACTFANATASCVAGTCTLGTCAAGFADCDGNPANGCEVDTRISTANCGRCANACTFANAAASCVSSACTLGTCAVGFANCDATAANGCETPLNTAMNCGGCGTTCSGATPVCDSMTRTCISGCSAGQVRCGGVCVDPRTDTSHCGGCGVPCTYTNAGATCAAAMCAIGTCNAGFANCDMMSANGCEVDTRTAPMHCGACGTVCAFANAAASCMSSTCTIGACTANFGNCDGMVANGCESNLTNTTAHCGACGMACSFANAAASCASSACVLGSCSGGFGNCDSNPANGCETTLTSLTHCGACGTACSRPNASASCATGTCTLGTCDSGWGNCDGDNSNGCETDLTNSTAHCGMCGNMCEAGTCMASVCTL